MLTRIKLSQNPLLVYQLRGVNLTYQRDKFIPIPYCRYMAEVSKKMMLAILKFLYSVYFADQIIKTLKS